MADEADISDERILRGVEEKRAALAAEQPVAVSVGYCLNCGPEVKLPEGQRWCDGDCRDDWEKERARQKRLAENTS
jgi:hypothetical protein